MATLKFTSRPSPVLTELRPIYKICQALLIMHLTGRGDKCSLVKLHLMNWAIKTPPRVETMKLAADLGQITLPVWGFDPALSMALNLAYSDQLIEPTTTGFELSIKGKQLVKTIMDDKSVMVEEKTALLKIGKKITEDMRNLNIIRGRNSAGKSTIVHSILYALGMEQLLGAQNDKALTYVLKDYVEYGGRKCFITRSLVMMELESNGKTITVTRKIREEKVDPRLVEIQECAVLTKGEQAEPLYRYLHDGGSAQIEEGYYTYLEKFLGLDLPQVPHKSGTQTKLYLQYIFAALAIEQKRGWTDYIANLPYFGVRDARIKIVDYLVGTNVFELDAKRARLDHESVQLNTAWLDITKALSNDAQKNSIQVVNLPTAPTAVFHANEVSYLKRTALGPMSLDEYKNSQFQALLRLQQEETKWKDATPEATLKQIEAETERLLRLTAAYEATLGELTLHRASRSANTVHLKQAQDELIKNKAAQKLINFGASLDLSIAKDVCPACHQD
uniref:Rad50/SbcC-type AAA domain-containing protein n=1 Tax=Anopheles melas TaxID=34690 RepID=A0A182UFN2_9DIPT